VGIFIPRRRFSGDQPELIDRPNAPPELLRGELRNLRVINARTGSLTLVQAGVTSLIVGMDPNRTIEILDLATGSADQPVSLVESLRRDGRLVSITAVDKNPIVLEAARAFAGHVPEIQFEQQDILALPYPDRSFDVTVCSFALHHFSRPDAVTILREMNRLSRVGFVVHDLSRGYPAAVATWLYTHLTTTNSMTRHDGTASVMGAFLTRELREMLSEAGVADAVVWKALGFRLMAVCKTRPRPWTS
jgi:ubiquinone/menaquinone biosynthesis C-methylase UbiE